MSLIRPFPGLRPKAGFADKVVAPPYDVLSVQEAIERAKDKPWSFLHISRPEIDLLDGLSPYDEAVYKKGQENFDRMRKEGVLVQDPEPYYYLYRLNMGEHEQTGLVAAASVEAYDQGRIKKHEFTHPDKEDDRVKQVDTLNAQTGPVFLTYRHVEELDELFETQMTCEPENDVTADDGVRHRIWVIKDQKVCQRITDLLEARESLYVADGHHRSAAASRVAAKRKEANTNHTGDETYNYFLTVIFPDNQMNILDYNRVVKDLNRQSKEYFLDALSKSFACEKESEAVRPAEHGEYGMYLDGQWYRLKAKTDLVAEEDPVKRLDVSLLTDYLIEPILGISDSRRDKRIDFVGGIRGLAELEKRVDSGDMAVAFSLFPTSLNDLMAVADAGEVMPPKSTWFEPKLADGLVSHLLDD